MKRVPFSHSTFQIVHEKALIKAKREGTTVSTVIHNFLLNEYTKDEPDPTEILPGSSPATNTEVPAADNQPVNTIAAVPEAINPEKISNSGESLEPDLETATKDPAPAEQPGANSSGEPVEAAAVENITAGHEPLAKEKLASPAKKKPTAGKQAKKVSSATVKNSPPKKELKKVTPKPGFAAKKNNKAGKSKKNKAKS